MVKGQLVNQNWLIIIHQSSYVSKSNGRHKICHTKYNLENNFIKHKIVIELEFYISIVYIYIIVTLLKIYNFLIIEKSTIMLKTV
jgi:hypothetical protein